MTRSTPRNLLLLTLACTLSQPASQAADWQSYHNDRFAYRLHYPAGWSAIEAGRSTTDGPHWSGDVLSPGDLQKVTFKEPEGKLWPGELVVLVREHAEGQSLDEWANTSFTDVHDDSLVTGAEDTVVAGQPARLFKVFGFDHTAIVVVFMHDGKSYEIGYTGSAPGDPDLAEHGSIYEHMKESFRLVPSARSDRFDLGGPCGDAEAASLTDFYTKYGQAARQGDHQQMIDLQKQYVRAMCSNHHRWYGLAETYVGAGQPDMAIQVLHELHRRGAEIKASTLRDHESLLELVDTPAFEESELGRELEELRSAASRRKQAQREQLQALDASARPPEDYVARGACPFECCVYREWEVLETTPLYDAPFGNVVVGSAVKGQRVRGVTGDVHLRPAAVAVVHDRAPFVRGEIIFVLDYVGEGFYRYWRKGEVAEEELWIDDVCLRPSRECWAEYVESMDERGETRWWVLIETEEGVRGWADRVERFGDKDACG